MEVGHVTDQTGITTIRRFLSSPQRLQNIPRCPEHGREINIRDDGQKIILYGCCRAAVYACLEEISKIVDWMDFYADLNNLEQK